MPDNIRVIAKAEMTPKQFEAFELECAGWGLTRISRYLGIARQTVWGRIDGAHRALEHQGVRQDASGNWYLEEAA